MKTTLSLADSARRGGASIHEGVAVLQIRHEQGRITGVETSEGFISAPTVILAAGPWTSTLHPDPRIHLPIKVERGQVCYSDRPGGLPQRELCFYDEQTGLYTHADGETNLVGLDWDFEHVWGPDDYQRETDPKYIEAAFITLGYRFPALARSRFIRGVVGLYDFTPDGLPIIDRMDLTGYYVAAGFSGAGFKSAPATGLGLAELVLDGRATSVDIDFLRLARFKR
jgi:sarcosine oxidase subunit beta